MEMDTMFSLESYKPIDRKIVPKVRKETGAHYTPQALADFVANQITKYFVQNSTGTPIRVLDPAVGDGELLLALSKMLLISDEGLELEFSGFDTDILAIEATKKRFFDTLPHIKLSIRQEDFVSFSLHHRTEGSLFPLPKYDAVIANPPYVRTQMLGAENSQDLAQKFGLSGRVDLYHVFICGISAILRPGGIAGIIVSNRFMTTKGGAEIRRRLQEEFEILHVWDLGDTQIFEAAVLPAVLLLRKKNLETERSRSKFTSIYQSDQTGSVIEGQNVVDALDRVGLVSLENGQSYLVQQGNLNVDGDNGGVWSIATQASDIWLSTVKDHTYCTFGDVGKIRVGVKTTADKIFIHSNWTSLPISEQPEVLKPLITHHIARQYRSHSISTSILYTHESKDGKRMPIDLDRFPITSRYLERHRTALESRDYVVGSERKWYEIWVPQDPALWYKPKIVFRDITSSPTFWIDLTGAVVNGDCYWLSNDYGTDDDLLWLALAVGNSTFIESFYDKSFNNKLYSGRRRFMTQYVEKFPLPSPHSLLPRQIVQKTKALFEVIPSSESDELVKEIDELVWQSFGFRPKEVVR